MAQMMIWSPASPPVNSGDRQLIPEWGMHVIVDHFGIDPGLLEQLRDTPVRMMSTCSKHMR